MYVILVNSETYETQKDWNLWSMGIVIFCYAKKILQKLS